MGANLWCALLRAETYTRQVFLLTLMLVLYHLLLPLPKPCHPRLCGALRGLRPFTYELREPGQLIRSAIQRCNPHNVFIPRIPPHLVVRWQSTSTGVCWNRNESFPDTGAGLQIDIQLVWAWLTLDRSVVTNLIILRFSHACSIQFLKCKGSVLKSAFQPIQKE